MCECVLHRFIHSAELLRLACPLRSYLHPSHPLIAEPSCRATRIDSMCSAASRERVRFRIRVEWFFCPPLTENPPSHKDGIWRASFSERLGRGSKPAKHSQRGFKTGLGGYVCLAGGSIIVHQNVSRMQLVGIINPTITATDHQLRKALAAASCENDFKLQTVVSRGTSLAWR